MLILLGIFRDSLTWNAELKRKRERMNAGVGRKNRRSGSNTPAAAVTAAAAAGAAAAVAVAGASSTASTTAVATSAGLQQLNIDASPFAVSFHLLFHSLRLISLDKTRVVARINSWQIFGCWWKSSARRVQLIRSSSRNKRNLFIYHNWRWSTLVTPPWIFQDSLTFSDRLKVWGRRMQPGFKIEWNDCLRKWRNDWNDWPPNEENQWNRNEQLWWIRMLSIHC